MGGVIINPRDKISGALKDQITESFPKFTFNLHFFSINFPINCRK